MDATRILWEKVATILLVHVCETADVLDNGPGKRNRDGPVLYSAHEQHKKRNVLLPTGSTNAPSTAGHDKATVARFWTGLPKSYALIQPFVASPLGEPTLWAFTSQVHIRPTSWKSKSTEIHVGSLASLPREKGCRQARQLLGQEIW